MVAHHIAYDKANNKEKLIAAREKPAPDAQRNQITHPGDPNISSGSLKTRAEKEQGQHKPNPILMRREQQCQPQKESQKPPDKGNPDAQPLPLRNMMRKRHSQRLPNRGNLTDGS